MNMLLAFVVAIAFFLLSGVPEVTGPSVTTVQTVNANSPAELAGFQPYDVIKSINEEPVTNNVTEAINRATQSGSQELRVVIERPGKGEMTLNVKPLYNPPQEWRRVGIGDTISAAFWMCVDAGRSILEALNNLIFRGQGAGEVTGIVGVTQTIVATTQQSQLPGYLYLMCLISVNLGLFNLLPIPGLDGSRILFLLVEAVRGKPFKKEGYVHAIGMLLLFALMIWINIRDILRLF